MMIRKISILLILSFAVLFQSCVKDIENDWPVPAKLKITGLKIKDFVPVDQRGLPWDDDSGPDIVLSYAIGNSGNTYHITDTIFNAQPRTDYVLNNNTSLTLDDPTETIWMRVHDIDLTTSGPFTRQKMLDFGTSLYTAGNRTDQSTKTITSTIIIEWNYEFLF